MFKQQNEEVTMMVEVTIKRVGASVHAIVTDCGECHGIPSLKKVDELLDRMQDVVRQMIVSAREEPESTQVRVMKASVDTRTNQVIGEEEVAKFDYSDDDAFEKALSAYADNHPEMEDEDDEPSIQLRLHKKGMKVS
jgi:hypothetical protein